MSVRRLLLVAMANPQIELSGHLRKWLRTIGEGHIFDEGMLERGVRRAICSKYPYQMLTGEAIKRHDLPAGFVLKAESAFQSYKLRVTHSQPRYPPTNGP